MLRCREIAAQGINTTRSPQREAPTCPRHLALEHYVKVTGAGISQELPDLLLELGLALGPQPHPQLARPPVDVDHHHRRRKLQPVRTRQLLAPIAVGLPAEAAGVLLGAPGLLQLPAREALGVDRAGAGAGGGEGAFAAEADPAAGLILVAVSGYCAYR